MTDDSEGGVLAAIEAKRGYVLDLHRLLAAWDPEFLAAYETMLDASSWTERNLDRMTKELIYVGVLTALRTPPHHLATHMRAALQHGATPRQLLEVIQLILPGRRPERHRGPRHLRDRLRRSSRRRSRTG